jgi:hypothetical protein
MSAGPEPFCRNRPPPLPPPPEEGLPPPPPGDEGTANSSSAATFCASTSRLYSYQTRFSWSQSLPAFDSTTASAELISPRPICSVATAAPVAGSAIAPATPFMMPLHMP